MSYFYQADRVSKYFIPDELDRNKDSVWDPVTQQVTSPMDQAMDELEEIANMDPDYIFELTEDLRHLVKPADGAVTAPVIDYDADSISTMQY